MARIPAALALAALLWAPAARAQTGGVINLSCVEALAAVDKPELAGVFSFVPEKDSHAAFADMLVRSKKSMGLFLEKVTKDRKKAGGISIWDQRVLRFALEIYASPLAETVGKPSAKTMARLNDLAASNALTLEELTSRRGR